jgi:fatty acyl-CoA reductase
MAERALKKNRGNLRVALVRPSIIVSCYEEPCRGWTDTLSAGGGIVFASQMGLIHWLKTTMDCLIDLVPCDVVSNMVLASTVYSGRQATPSLNISTASTTYKNPCDLRILSTYVLQAGKYHEYLR